MSSFRPRKIINGRLLTANIDTDCSILLNIEDVDGPGLLAGQSTDGVQVRVQCSPNERFSAGGWMEIIGRPTGAGAIRATEVIVFGSQPSGGAGAAGEVEPFDTDGHNMLVTFLNLKSAEELFVAQ